MGSFDLSKLGIRVGDAQVHQDTAPARLIEFALAAGEGFLTHTGALQIYTGKYTGRSPKDRFFVDTPEVHDKIAWSDTNVAISQESWEKVRARAVEHLSGRDLYVQRLFAGADRKYARRIVIVSERAAHSLFCNDLFVRPTEDELAAYGEADFTVIHAPDCTCIPEEDGTRSEAAVLVNLSEREIVICGTSYAGEIKKSIFTVMNYLLVDEDDILPMHCSANMDTETRDTAVFFGLSGTGKTTLSADPARGLIGDDEHAWTDEGIFNFEGGCYAKTIDISAETEPDIFAAIRFGALAENVVVDEKTRVPDYFDASITENGRVGYPVSFIGNSVLDGQGGTPTVVIFLTADAFGVLPPVSRLDENAAMYHFMSGFTSKVAGTERGITEPVPTFSTLFGEPFMPLNPSVYAEKLGANIEKHGTRVYLVNTGWTGGPYGVGSRIKLGYTRQMVTSILTGEIEHSEFRHDDTFNVDVPTSLEGVPSELLDPKSTWEDKDAYDAQAAKLAGMFEENFAKKYADAPDHIRAAGPHA